MTGRMLRRLDLQVVVGAERDRPSVILRRSSVETDRGRWRDVEGRGAGRLAPPA